MSFKFDDSGLDKLEKKLKTISSNAEAINGTYQLGDIFNPKFMKTYTDYASIDSFFAASPFKIEKEEDFNNINEDELDNFVRNHSSFNNWDSLKGKAGEIYIANQLGL